MAAFVMGAIAFLRAPDFLWSRLALIAAACRGGQRQPQQIGRQRCWAAASRWPRSGLLARGRPFGPIGPVAPLAAPGPWWRAACRRRLCRRRCWRLRVGRAGRAHGRDAAQRCRGGRAFALLAALGLAVAALTSAKAIHNAVEHGNPFYPCSCGSDR
jgi:hypothetical protein